MSSITVKQNEQIPELVVNYIMDCFDIMPDNTLKLFIDAHADMQQIPDVYVGVIAKDMNDQQVFTIPYLEFVNLMLIAANERNLEVKLTK